MLWIWKVAAWDLILCFVYNKRPLSRQLFEFDNIFISSFLFFAFILHSSFFILLSFFLSFSFFHFLSFSFIFFSFLSFFWFPTYISRLLTTSSFKVLDLCLATSVYEYLLVSLLGLIISFSIWGYFVSVNERNDGCTITIQYSLLSGTAMYLIPSLFDFSGLFIYLLILFVLF